MRRSYDKLSSDRSQQSDILSPRTYFTAPSLCNIFLPSESSPFFFLSEYMSSGSQMGLAGPMLARARAKGVRTYCRRGRSSGRAQFSQRNLMEDP